MPPKKKSAVSHAVHTKHRTRSAVAEAHSDSPPNKVERDASSSEDSDIEIDIGEDSQVTVDC